MIFEKDNSKSKENNQENNRSEGRRRKYFKTCELCWMLLKIKKYKLQQVIIKFGKATMIIVVSMKCGMWRHFKWFQEKSGRCRGSKDVIANNFFKWFYCGISEKCNHRWKEWDERTACTTFFLIIRDIIPEGIEAWQDMYKDLQKCGGRFHLHPSFPFPCPHQIPFLSLCSWDLPIYHFPGYSEILSIC